MQPLISLVERTILGMVIVFLVADVTDACSSGTDELYRFKLPANLVGNKSRCNGWWTGTHPLLEQDIAPLEHAQTDAAISIAVRAIGAPQVWDAVDRDAT